MCVTSRLPRPSKFFWKCVLNYLNNVFLVFFSVANSKHFLNSTTTSSSTSLTSSMSKPARTKLPNFAAIHQKQFQKMENLADHVARKQERSKNLINSNSKIRPGKNIFFSNMSIRRRILLIFCWHSTVFLFVFEILFYLCTLLMVIPLPTIPIVVF